MTENLNTPANASAERRNKAKKAGIAGGGLLGIGAIATVAILGTGANWQDSESVGADFNSGSFNLQVQTATTDGFVDGDSIDPFEDLGITPGPWGPGDTASADFQLQLEDGTTHNAVITLDSFVDAASDQGWDVTVTDSLGVDVTTAEWSNDLATGVIADFSVEVEFLEDPTNTFQGENATNVYTFGAESVSEGDLS